MCDVVYRKHFAVGTCPLCSMLYNRKHFAVEACPLCAMLYTECTLLLEIVHCVRCCIQKALCFRSLSIVCDVVYRKHFAVVAFPLCAMLYTESTLL